MGLLRDLGGKSKVPPGPLTENRKKFEYRFISSFSLMSKVLRTAYSLVGEGLAPPVVEVSIKGVICSFSLSPKKRTKKKVPPSISAIQ